MLQCSFSFAAAQLLVQMTSVLHKSKCCNAVAAAQHSENCSATSVFACGMLQGWGLEGSGLGVVDCNALHIPQIEIASGFRAETNQRRTATQGCDGKSLAIGDFQRCDVCPNDRRLANASALYRGQNPQNHFAFFSLFFYVQPRRALPDPERVSLAPTQRKLS